MNLAIIPARGGSKRIPGKNIKLFFGKPMIEYSIQAAIKSGLFDQVIVSTDCSDIAKVAIACGAEVPSLRPPELSNDFTPTAPVLIHAIQELASKEKKFKNACCILATAPMTQPGHIQAAFDLLLKNQAGAVFSATTYPYPIFRAFKRNSNGYLEYVWPEYEMTRSNDLPETLHDAGQFYWLNIPKFLTTKKMMIPQSSLPYVIPRKLVQDIDTPEDWEVAELAFEKLNFNRLSGELSSVN